jgi:tetratricopeptide (TPR) repeat protein
LQDDPLNLIGRLRFAQCLRAAGRNAEAFGALRNVLELDESLWFTHFILGLELLLDGRVADALPHAERACALAPWNPSAKGLLAAAARNSGDLRRAEDLLEELESGGAYGAPLALATFYLSCAKIDASADWTERAIEERHPAIFFFLRPHAHALRRSARWPNLARRLNLPDAPGEPGLGPPT